MDNRLDVTEEKEKWGAKVAEKVQASKPLSCLVEWDKMKERLFVPNVFKPSYVKMYEQNSRMNFKFAADKSSMWVKLSNENRAATNVKSPNAILKGEHPDEKSLSSLECLTGDSEIDHGRYYWEVEVNDQTEWAVGVAYTSVERNKQFGETRKSWVLRKMPTGKIEARHMGRTEGEIKWNPHVVGISFNYEKGILGVYDAESGRQLFYFMSSFCEPCVPAFMLGPQCTLQLIFPSEKARDHDYFSRTVQSYNIDRDYNPQISYWRPQKPYEFQYEPDRWQLPLKGRSSEGKFTIQRYHQPIEPKVAST